MKIVYSLDKNELLNFATYNKLYLLYTNWLIRYKVQKSMNTEASILTNPLNLKV